MRKYGKTLLITPAKSNVLALHEKISRCLQTALGLSQGQLIRKLNPLLRGWANYYRHGAAKATFDKLDSYVFRKLWRWIKRRHPNKSADWRKRKYFSAAGKGWHFSVRSKKAVGEAKVLELYRLASTQILRYIKIQGPANPYDPKYAAYFDHRRYLYGRVWGNLAKAKANSNRSNTERNETAACPHHGAPVRGA